MSFLIIGTPNQSPRLLIPHSDADIWDSRNILEGEVILPCDAPGDYIISADGLSLLPKTMPLIYLQDKKYGDISKKFREIMAAGCNTPKGRADCDDIAQQRVTSAILMADKRAALGLPDNPIPWTMYDKSVVDHSRDDLVSLGISIGNQMQLAFTRKQQLEADVKAATTEAELNVIDATTGWPS